MNSFAIFIVIFLSAVIGYLIGELMGRSSSRHEIKTIRNKLTHDRLDLLATITRLESANRNLQGRLSILQQQLRSITR
jgi:hypothetical protein